MPDEGDFDENRLPEQVPESPALGRRVIRGGLWVFGLRITSRLLTFVSLLVLARLLAPADFGLLGITLLTIAVLEVFTQTGFQAALVQKKGDTEQFLNTAWTVHAVRGLALYGILYFIAPLVGSFFETPGVVPLLRVVGITLILRGLANIRVLYFQKELEFHKEFIYRIASAIAHVAVSISLAVVYRSVWALVLGQVASAFTQLVFSYILIPRLPRFRFDRAHFKEMFTFGRWVFASSVLVFLITQGDDAFVGKMLGATALGFYQLAYRISNMPATEITHVISQVTFPAYSKMQDDIPRLREAYLKVLQLTTFFAFPIAGMIFVLGGDFTRLFLGEKWLPMVPAMRILCLYGTAISVGGTASPVIYGTGFPKVQTKLSAIQLCLIAVTLYPLVRLWGIVGCAISVTTATAFIILPLAREIIDILEMKWKTLSNRLAPSILGTAVILVCHRLVLHFSAMESIFVRFMVRTIIYISLYCVVYYLVRRTVTALSVEKTAFG